jgi:hypothetical protein
VANTPALFSDAKESLPLPVGVEPLLEPVLGLTETMQNLEQHGLQV